MQAPAPNTRRRPWQHGSRKQLCGYAYRTLPCGRAQRLTPWRCPSRTGLHCSDCSDCSALPRRQVWVGTLQPNPDEKRSLAKQVPSALARGASASRAAASEQGHDSYDLSLKPPAASSMSRCAEAYADAAYCRAELALPWLPCQGRALPLPSCSHPGRF